MPFSCTRVRYVNTYQTQELLWYCSSGLGCRATHTALDTQSQATLERRIKELAPNLARQHLRKQTRHSVANLLLYFDSAASDVQIFRKGL